MTHYNAIEEYNRYMALWREKRADSDTDTGMTAGEYNNLTARYEAVRNLTAKTQHTTWEEADIQALANAHRRISELKRQLTEKTDALITTERTMDTYRDERDRCIEMNQRQDATILALKAERDAARDRLQASHDTIASLTADFDAATHYRVRFIGDIGAHLRHGS